MADTVDTSRTSHPTAPTPNTNKDPERDTASAPVTTTALRAA